VKSGYLLMFIGEQGRESCIIECCDARFRWLKSEYGAHHFRIDKDNHDFTHCVWPCLLDKVK